MVGELTPALQREAPLHLQPPPDNRNSYNPVPGADEHQDGFHPYVSQPVHLRVGHDRHADHLQVRVLREDHAVQGAQASLLPAHGIVHHSFIGITNDMGAFCTQSKLIPTITYA